MWSFRCRYDKVVKGATVDVLATAPWSWTEYRTGRTTAHGQASFALEGDHCGLWSICLTDISKHGYEYERWENNDLCDSIWYP